MAFTTSGQETELVAILTAAEPTQEMWLLFANRLRQLSERERPHLTAPPQCITMGGSCSARHDMVYRYAIGVAQPLCAMSCCSAECSTAGMRASLIAYTQP